MDISSTVINLNDCMYEYMHANLVHSISSYGQKRFPCPIFYFFLAWGCMIPSHIIFYSRVTPGNTGSNKWIDKSHCTLISCLLLLTQCASLSGLWQITRLHRTTKCSQRKINAVPFAMFCFKSSKWCSNAEVNPAQGMDSRTLMLAIWTITLLHISSTWKWKN